MLIIIYDSSFHSLRKIASPIKETHSCLLRKSSTAISSSTDAPNLSGSITERHADNSFLRNEFIHLWTHIGVEFTQYVRSTASTLGEDSLLFYFLTFCTHFSTCICSSWFLPLAPLFILCFITKVVAFV